MDHHQIGDPRAQSIYDTAGPHNRSAAHHLTIELLPDEGSSDIYLCDDARGHRKRGNPLADSIPRGLQQLCGVDISPAIMSGVPACSTTIQC